MDKTVESLNRLQEYEQAAKNYGFDMSLLSKIGTVMYLPSRGEVVPMKIEHITIGGEEPIIKFSYCGDDPMLDRWHIHYRQSDLGKNIFFTEVEAEKNL